MIMHAAACMHSFRAAKAACFAKASLDGGDDFAPRFDSDNGFVDDLHGWNFSLNARGIEDKNGHGTHVAGKQRQQGLCTVQSGLGPCATECSKEA